MAIPVKTVFEVEDSIETEDVAEAFIGDARWVMRTQADLYSNRELAVCREYSTNAYDANVERAWVEAGSPLDAEGRPMLTGFDIAPVEVTLPTMMEPNRVIIRDKGFGMSRETLREVYIGFGLSSKRDSHLTNGQLGYGSKSALAYTEQFTVVSVHEGIRTTALIKRRDDWSIVLKIVSQEKTDDESGTTVIVPVNDWQAFHHKAMDFYKFWLPGRVLVNGKEPEHFAGSIITDGLYYSDHWNRSYIVMSNVPYVIENPSALFRNSKMSSLNFVAYVDTVYTPDGSKAAVEFTPSREALKYTDHTKATLQQIINDFETKIVEAAKAEIEAATTHAEAYTLWSKWTSTLGKQLFADLEFKGDKFKSEFSIIGTRYQTSGYTYGGAVQRISQWNVESSEKTLYVTEFDLVMTSKHKKMIKEFAAREGRKHYYVIFTSKKESEIDCVWIDRSNFVTWQHIKDTAPVAPKKPRAQRPGRIKGTFDYWTKDGKVREKEIPEDAKEIYYLWVKSEDHTPIKALLRRLKSDGIVVLLGANRFDKFKRDNPGVQEFMPYAQSKVVIDAETLLSDDAKACLAIDHDTRNWINWLEVDKLDDPEFAKVKPLLAREDELLADYRANLALASEARMRYNVKEYEEDEGESIFVKYPLLARLGRLSENREHIYLYMNAVHAAAEKENNV